METDGMRPHRRTPRVRRSRIRARREARGARREARGARREARGAIRDPRSAIRDPRSAIRDPRSAIRNDAITPPRFFKFRRRRAKMPPPTHARRQTAHIPPSITSSAPVT
ncbi:RNA-binding protein [Burkholderia pseudomallei]|nr:RNA-binding protein [Burkholderia pseudomallei]APZ27747.1 RNA-binding protein [Burkholderia pseudomallei]OMZ56671.1 RNA-binding protein [Burkholderia pseudomallei]